MPLSYRTKQEILNYLSSPANWSDKFDAEWFGTHHSLRKSDVLQNSQFFHEITFSANDWVQKFEGWNNLAPPSMNAYNLTQIIVAHDLGLEPDLCAENRPSLEHLGDNRVSLEIEKPWQDVTQFEGHVVHWPRQFFAQTDTSGFALRTTLGDREKIWSFGKIFGEAARHGKSLDVGAQSTMESRALVDALHAGNDAEDHRGNTWIYTLLDSKEARALARNLRETFHTALAAPNESVFAVNYDEKGCLVAVREEELLNLHI